MTQEQKKNNIEPKQEPASTGRNKSDPINERSPLSTINEEEKDDLLPKPKTWWKRKEVIGGVGLVVLNTLASPVVAAASPWIPLVANMALGILIATGLVQGKNANNLKPTRENYVIGK